MVNTFFCSCGDMITLSKASSKRKGFEDKVRKHLNADKFIPCRMDSDNVNDLIRVCNGVGISVANKCHLCYRLMVGKKKVDRHHCESGKHPKSKNRPDSESKSTESVKAPNLPPSKLPRVCRFDIANSPVHGCCFDCVDEKQALKCISLDELIARLGEADQSDRIESNVDGIISKLSRSRLDEEIPSRYHSSQSSGCGSRGKRIGDNRSYCSKFERMAASESDHSAQHILFDHQSLDPCDTESSE